MAKTRGRPPGSSAKNTPRPNDRGFTSIRLTLPRFYMRVLDGDAAFLGQRRSEFLDLMIQRKAGLLKAERSSRAPKYKMEAGELDETEQYLWYCRDAMRTHLDALRKKMGNIAPTNFVILALNEWIGLPSGIRDL